MQNSPTSTRKLHGLSTRQIPKSEGNEYSFTSFTPLSPESTKGSFSFSKLFQWKSSESKPIPKSSGAEALPHVEVKNEAKSKSSPTPNQGRSLSPSLRSKIPRSWSSPRFQRRQGSGLSGSPGQGKHLPQGYRNLSALFKRLSAAADYSKGDQPSQPYKESHFRQYWMPDEHCKECYECGEKFNTFRRRHHCRLCGQIFCYRCCNIEIPGELMGYSGGLRVCTYCNKVFQTYTQSPDMLRNLEQLQADIQAVSMETDYSLHQSSSLNALSVPRAGNPFDEEDKYSLSSSRKTSSSSSSSMYIEKLEQRESRPPTTMQNVRSPFDAFGVCAAEANMLKQDSLREIWHLVMSKRSGLELTNHRFRLKTYQNCFVATDLVEWLITHEKAMTRYQAVAIGQALLESGWLEPVPQTRDVQEFRDEYALYQPGQVALKDQAGNPRSSRSYSESILKGESVNEDSEDDNEDDDETAPQWFRQLPGYESGEELDAGESVEVDPVSPAGILNVPKHTRTSGAKLLDLDTTTASEKEESELALKVNLDHFGEGNTGSSEGLNTENQGPTLALTTDVPPPPLEQYVYTEGYPITSLRAPYYRRASETPVLATSAEDVLKGAMMAKRIGVDRPKPDDPKTLRDDNNERLAMERICKSRAVHASRLVVQLLTDVGLSLEWKDVIMPLVAEISEKVAPDVRKDDDMDIRQYVKFKKIPGGKKSDCEVVWGVGFTKNVSNKKMCSSFVNPRILVLCCAIDYQRKENRLASLDPLILQENEFLKNFVARVAALRPNVLLVEKTVSRLAQDMLLQHGITLALNVKPEVIERVARCTKADVLRSMEQLSRPHLGTCQQFRVRKYTLKNGETKTLMFFDGCPPELGCTVSLRGGNILVLAKVKKIVQFVTYVAYSQKLETAFLMDEFALPEEPLYPRAAPFTTNNENSNTETNKDAEETNSDLNEKESLYEADVFQQALNHTVLSSSPYVRYPLPYLLTPEGVRSAVRSRLPKEIYWSARLANEKQSSYLTEKELEEFELPNLKRNVHKSVQILDAHPFVCSSVVVNSNDQFILGVLADFRSQGGRILLKRRNVESDGRRKSKWLMLESEDVEKESKVDDVEGKTREGSTTEKKSQKTIPLDVKCRIQDDLATPVHFNRKIDCLDPNYLHQRIAVLFSSYSSESNNSPRPCISPWAVFMEFYGRNDITLGGFLERYCFRPSYVCPNPNCDIPMVDHVRYFAHGNGSVYIHMKNLESPIPGFQHTILTWSWCKECKQVTPIVPLSSDAWALSFAKYIELRFYADHYTRRASVEPCGHSLHQQHYQYFAYANMVASFKYRAIKLYETAIPPPSISVKDEVRDGTYWVQDVGAISTRGDTVFASILERLDTLKAAKIDFHAPERDSKLAQFTVQLEKDHARFTEQVEAVNKKVKVLQSLQNPLDVLSFDQRDQQALGYVIADGVNGLKRILCESVENWNNRLQEFIQVEKKRTSKTGNQRDAKPGGDKTDNSLSAKSMEDFRELSEDPAQFAFAPPGFSPAFSPWNSRNVSPFVPTEGSDSDLESQVSDVDSSKRDMYFSPIATTDDVMKKDDRTADFEGSLTQDKREILDREGLENSLKQDVNGDANETGDGSGLKDERKPFVRGHRRVMSYPSQVIITESLDAFVSKSLESLRIKKNDEGLVRSKSDTDVCVFEEQIETKDKTLESSTNSSPSATLKQKDEAETNDLIKRSKRPVSLPETSSKKNTEQDSPNTSTDGTPAIRRRDKMKNIISSFLPGSTFQPVASSFPSHEHHLLPPGERVSVVISEKEPSSIIAYALSTKDYNHRLCEIQASIARLSMGTIPTPQETTTEHKEKNTQQQLNESYEDSRDQSTVSSMISVDENEEDFVNVEIKGVNDIENNSSTEYVEIIEDIQDPTPVRVRRSSTIERQDKVKFSKSSHGKESDEVKGQTTMNGADRLNQNCSEKEANSDLGSLSEFGFQPSVGGKEQALEFHIQMQFSYNVCRFYCNAYYAEQFRKLRKHTFTDGEERYIRSLAHCVVWRARGGKSGSSFSKSLDDRFVLKQMSRLELQSFVEFAPHYFQYINKAIKEKRPTSLAKIFGVYRIGFKNTQTNTTMRQDVLVMENLFYDRKIDKIFDLKGSMRSRYVQVSGRENDVLMDENLLEMIREYPIFIRPHSKAVLSKAIHNDTEFLAHHMVMDYSLLIGIDELRSELVIGIIDFIRTFTWDKKLEMYVKSSGILGGQGKMPTVVSPELYRTRFSEAMQRYFLMVPDKWTGLGNDLE